MTESDHVQSLKPNFGKKQLDVVDCTRLSGVALGSLYFLSGAVALAYEVSWNRQFGLLFGHSEQAAAVVLGAYFTGLGIGYFVGGRLSLSTVPLRSYAIVELIAAAWAFLIPRILEVVEHSPVVQLLSSSSVVYQTASRAIMAFVILLPATLALGASFPLISASYRLIPGKQYVWSSLCYGLNTLGACLGIVLTTFFLLISAGVRGSSDLAAMLGVVIGISAWGMSRSLRRHDSADRTLTSKLSPTNRNQGWELNSIAALSGFGVIALEVLYTRLFSLVFHNSSYTFGLIIAVFLLSLSLAALLVPLLLRYLTVDALLIVSASLGTLLLPISVAVFVERTGFNYFPLTDNFQTYLLSSFWLTASVISPPVVVLGMLLPALWKLIPSDQLHGQALGTITMTNSLSSGFGAIAAGFLLLPFLGLWHSFAVLSIIFLVLAVAKLIQNKQRISGAILILISTPAIALLWSGGQHWEQSYSSDETLLRRWESTYGWIDVVQNEKTSARKVRQNLHYRHGSTGNDSVRERRQALLPLTLHASPKKVLHLGLGTGITAAGTLDYPGIVSVTIVELIPEVVEAASYLGEGNQKLFEDSRVQIRIDDARHDLLSHQDEYDVIISDLFVPWESQTGYLYTQEHFQSAKTRLRVNGLYCQWLPLYQMGLQEFQMITDTFASVFPQTTLWWGHLNPNKPMIALIGSEESLELLKPALEERLERLNAKLEPNDSWLSNPERLRLLSIGSWKLHPQPVFNTDEHPRIEFLTPLSHLDRRLITGPRLKECYEKFFEKLSPITPSMTDEHQHQIHEEQKIMLTLD